MRWEKGFSLGGGGLLNREKDPEMKAMEEELNLMAGLVLIEVGVLFRNVRDGSQWKHHLSMFPSDDLLSY